MTYLEYAARLQSMDMAEQKDELLALWLAAPVGLRLAVVGLLWAAKAAESPENATTPKE